MNLINDSIEIQNLTVDYGSQLGIDNISLSFSRGKIHAVVGDHGAGKSTLVGAIAGNIRYKNGRIFLYGSLLDTRSPDRVLNQGILTIYQKVQIIPALSAYENIYLNQSWKKNIFLRNKRKMRAHLLEVLSSLGLDIDIDCPMVYYRSNQQQLVEVARVLCFPAEVVMIDELSTKLAPVEMERIHQLMKMLTEKGVTIIYVSHNMREVVEFASSVTILQRGKIVETKSIQNTNELELIQLTYSFMYPRKDLENQNIELFQGKRLHAGIIKALPIPLIVLGTDMRVILINESANELIRNLSQPAEYDSDTSKTSIGVGYIWDVLGVNSDEIDNIKNTLEEDESGSLHLSFKDKEGRNLQLFFHHILDNDTFLGVVILFENYSIKSNYDYWEKIPLNIRTMAHELNNPLSITLNHLELALRTDDTEKIKSHISAVEKEIYRVSRMIRKTLKEKDEDGKPINRKKICRIETVMEECACFLQERLKTSDIELIVSGSSDVTIPLSSEEAKTVFLNLIINSLEAMEELQHKGRVTISWEKFDKSVKIDVADNGPGISQDIVPMLFKPFVTTRRLSEETSFPRGTGLSLCKRIVTNGAGEIRYISESASKDSAGVKDIRTGAHFEIVLPLAEIT